MIEKERLVNLLSERLSTMKIAKALGCSRNTVLYWERKYDLKPAFQQLGHARTDRSPGEMVAAMIQAPTASRRRMKARAVRYKGGECVICGYDKCNAALEFHHVDKANKSFGLSKNGVIRSWDSIRKELDKCVLVCSNCHREIEAGVTSVKNQTS